MIQVSFFSLQYIYLVPTNCLNCLYKTYGIFSLDEEFWVDSFCSSSMAFLISDETVQLFKSFFLLFISSFASRFSPSFGFMHFYHNMPTVVLFEFTLKFLQSINAIFMNLGSVYHYFFQYFFLTLSIILCILDFKIASISLWFGSFSSNLFYLSSHVSVHLYPSSLISLW